MSDAAQAGAPAMTARKDAPRDATWLIAVAALAVTAEVLATVVAGRSDDGLRQLVRVTARTSAAWFVIAFAARPLVTLWPSPSTKWLLRNRRYFGLAVAVSHFTHLAAIGFLAGRDGDAFFETRKVLNTVVGGISYGLLLAMVLTSTDRAQARLGRRRWRTLHLAGMWLMWFIFTISYAKEAGRDATATVATAVLAAVLALRVTVFIRARRRARR